VARHLAGGEMKATPKCLKCGSLTVTTIKPWTAAVAAIGASWCCGRVEIRRADVAHQTINHVESISITKELPSLVQQVINESIAPWGYGELYCDRVRHRKTPKNSAI
jgi:hypothetical protein